MICCKNLTIKSDIDLISSLNLELKKNQFWAILGKNGVGKSTLVHHLAGLLKSSSGEIKIENKNLSSYSPLERAQLVSLLSQKQEASLDGSVEQMVQFGRFPWQNGLVLSSEDQQIIKRAIQFCELEPLLSKSTNELSGGELRRVELANVLVQNTFALLLDEPLNHMDLSFKLKFLEEMKRQQSEKLIVMITHDLHFVQKYCTHVLFIGSQGQWQAGDMHTTLTNNNLNKYLDIEANQIDLSI